MRTKYLEFTLFVGDMISRRIEHDEHNQSEWTTVSIEDERMRDFQVKQAGIKAKSFTEYHEMMKSIYGFED